MPGIGGIHCPRRTGTAASSQPPSPLSPSLPGPILPHLQLTGSRCCCCVAHTHEEEEHQRHSIAGHGAGAVSTAAHGRTMGVSVFDSIALAFCRAAMRAHRRHELSEPLDSMCRLPPSYTMRAVARSPSLFLAIRRSLYPPGDPGPPTPLSQPSRAKRRGKRSLLIGSVTRVK